MPTCACGHEHDEHENGGRECAVDDCPCVHYEADEDSD